MIAAQPHPGPQPGSGHGHGDEAAVLASIDIDLGDDVGPGGSGTTGHWSDTHSHPGSFPDADEVLELADSFGAGASAPHSVEYSQAGPLLGSDAPDMGMSEHSPSVGHSTPPSEFAVHEPSVHEPVSESDVYLAQADELEGLADDASGLDGLDEIG
jgi:hypothetical protein